MVSRQRFPWPLSLILLVPVVVIGILMSVVSVTQQSWEPIGGGLIAIGVIVLIQVFIYLELTLDSTGIDLQWSPFIHKRYRWEDIAEAEVVTYDPLWEFGGWGVKYSRKRKAWAYSIWGDQALRLRLKSGKQLYIGVKDEAAVRDALHLYRRRQVV